MSSKDEDDGERAINIPLEWADPRNARPKRMRIDLSFNDTHSHIEDLFEFNPDEFIHSLWFPRFHRPLPAFSNVLSTVSTGSRKDKDQAEDDTENYKTQNLPPFLQEYFHRVNQTSEDVADQRNLDMISKSGNDDDLMDNINEALVSTSPSLSTFRTIPDQSAQDTPPSILDTTSTLLTQGHHKRLRGYLSELDNGENMQWNRLDPLRLKEFQKLCTLLEEERRLYFQAMQEFREAYMNRFLLGFTGEGPASSFVHAYPEYYIQFYRNAWKNSDWKMHTHFGSQSAQAIALQSYSCKIEENSFHLDLKEMMYNAPTIKDPTEPMHGIDMDSFSPTIVYTSTDSDLIRLQQDWIDSCLAPGSTLLPQSSIPLRLDEGTRFLSDDLHAKALACEYGADIIMTSRTMEYLLQRPGSCTTQWSIPISYEDMAPSNKESSTRIGRKQSNIIVMDDPIPQSLTPRQCLTYGISDTIYKQMAQSNPSSLNTLEKKSDSQFQQVVFTLLTIPAIGGMTKPFKVLVRSYNRILDELGRPIRIQSHLEYFLDRGLEEYTSYERSIWRLEKMLQPNCRVILSRIDVQNMKVVSTDDTSTFMVGQSARSLVARILLPLDKEEHVHFQSFAFLLHGVLTNTSKGRYLLCMPSKDASVSFPLTTATFHKSFGTQSSGESSSGSNTMIDIEKELETATGVSLGRKSLLSCFRLWTWPRENNWIPYTFKPLT